MLTMLSVHLPTMPKDLWSSCCTAATQVLAVVVCAGAAICAAMPDTTEYPKKRVPDEMLHVHIARRSTSCGASWHVALCTSRSLYYCMCCCEWFALSTMLNVDNHCNLCYQGGHACKICLVRAYQQQAFLLHKVTPVSCINYLCICQFLHTKFIFAHILTSMHRTQASFHQSCTKLLTSKLRTCCAMHAV